MSTIKSSAENLTLNADGSGNDIKFQSNGVEKGSLTAEGVMTATSFAGSGANLTGINPAKLVAVITPSAVNEPFSTPLLWNLISLPLPSALSVRFSALDFIVLILYSYGFGYLSLTACRLT
jgi:hypothetical protein